MKSLLSELKTSLLLTFVFVVLLCGVYPLAVWAGAQVLFPAKANGSLLTNADGSVRGSALLAQNFSSGKYFQPRPSAAGTGFDATSSGGTNLGPTSQKLADNIKAAVAAYRAADARLRRSGASRRGYLFRQRPRSAHQPRQCRTAGAPRGPGPRPVTCPNPRVDQPEHRRPGSRDLG